MPLIVVKKINIGSQYQMCPFIAALANIVAFCVWLYKYRKIYRTQ